jgi:microsomal epoxide hydrolase
MMSPTTKAYGTLPASATGHIESFEIHIEEKKVKDFVDLLRLSPVARDCYENQEAQRERGFGVEREWLVCAKEVWLNEFGWYVSLIPSP